jgi:hypothetical protein
MLAGDLIGDPVPFYCRVDDSQCMAARSATQLCTPLDRSLYQHLLLSNCDMSLPTDPPDILRYL